MAKQIFTAKTPLSTRKTYFTRNGQKCKFIKWVGVYVEVQMADDPYNDGPRQYAGFLYDSDPNK